ncbi:MAG: tRNA (guanosine(37)-N1)-methyltransferase TrmD [Candidatus Xenobia bacterium]
MRIDVVTLFPEMFAPLSASILKRAQDAGKVEIHLRNLRDYTHDRHRTVDDVPFGGGAGMVLKAGPIFECMEALRAEGDGKALLMSPAGRRFSQGMASELARQARLILFCGHYEGFDERVRGLFDEELSIGDYVLTGGELPAMVIADAVVRLLPGVLAEDSLHDESFHRHLLEYPQYTRPRMFRDMEVPEVLLSGHHARIEAWRHRQAFERTAQRRPDLLEGRELTPQERRWLQDLGGGIGLPGG